LAEFEHGALGRVLIGKRGGNPDSRQAAVGADRDCGDDGDSQVMGKV
jgi:hypothetical protein